MSTIEMTNSAESQLAGVSLISSSSSSLPFGVRVEIPLLSYLKHCTDLLYSVLILHV